jgi:GNAT superfamily N-acetyltransferase
MGSYQIKVEDKPAAEDIQVLRRGLSDFNFAQTGLRGQLICVLVRDHEGQIVGGANGWTAFGWLHTDILWLAENLRRKGSGREVLKTIEAEAKKRGCKFAKLETFSFQALDFYKKNGYTVFAELDQVVGDHRWYFLKKDLKA